MDKRGDSCCLESMGNNSVPQRGIYQICHQINNVIDMLLQQVRWNRIQRTRLWSRFHDNCFHSIAINCMKMVQFFSLKKCRMRARRYNCQVLSLCVTLYHGNMHKNDPVVVVLECVQGVKLLFFFSTQCVS